MISKHLLPHCIFCAPLAFTLTLHAAPVTKSGTGTDLADGTSWGGTGPASSDVATWSAGSFGGSLSLGSNASWQGIAITGATADVNLSGAGNLTLGSSVNVILANDITLGADQTWQAATGHCSRILVRFAGRSFPVGPVPPPPWLSRPFITLGRTSFQTHETT